MKKLESDPIIKEIVKYIADDGKRHIHLLKVSCKLLKKALK